MTVNPLLWPVVGVRNLIGGQRGARFVNRRLPSGKRCKACYAPFLGPCSVPYRLVQIRPSRKNPNLCTL
jgi:hypothetical protein